MKVRTKTIMSRFFKTRSAAGAVVQNVIFGLFAAAIVVLLVGYFSSGYAQPAAAATIGKTLSAPAESAAAETKVPVGKVKTVSFLLNDGRYVQGKVVSEDRSGITVSEFAGSTIVLSTYNRGDIAPRSIKYKAMPESTYWQVAAEYFHGRTWDFEDDPDDFIQALRCYESAKALVVGTYGPEYEQAKQLQQKIDQIRADKERWAAETESRASLRQLELEAVIDQRMNRLEQILSQNTEKLRKITALLEDSQLGANIAEIQRNIQILSRQLRSDVDLNKRKIDDLYYLYGRYGRTSTGPFIQQRRTR